jgi:hypothetical protein
MVWVVFGLVILIILLIIFFWLHYLRRNRILKKDVSEMKKKVEYMHQLFDSHFQTTDNTIVDTRNERDFWKEKALKLEKK